jgi:hypothetical protein
MTKLLNSTTIVVSSCDKFQDVWSPFFTLFFRYWPDCPFPIFLIANQQSYPDDRVKTILAGEDRGWATNLRLALDKVPTPYVLYLQEDYFLAGKADTATILDLVAYMSHCRAGCLRLYPCPGPDLPCADNDYVGMISKTAPYRVSLQAALWDKEVLRSLLVDEESGWDMEIKGTERSRSLDVPFFSVKRDPATNQVTNLALPYFCTAIVRGRWVREAVELCRREGMIIDDRRRSIETARQLFWRQSRLLNWARETLRPAFCRMVGLKKSSNIRVRANEFIVK